MMRRLERIIRSETVVACSGLAWAMVACSDKVVIGAKYKDAADSSVDPDAGDPTSALESCPNLPGSPKGIPPLPSTQQLALQRAELMAFIHFGVTTFDLGTTPPAALFNPTNLDVTEWATEYKNAGFRGVILVAKHDTGFCLWPSAYTEYSVRNSPWKNGQGDLVREFVDAMRAQGLRPALYLSPWDKAYPSSSPSYEQYVRNQVTELLTNYGPIYEIEFPGNDAPTLDWAGIAQLCHQLQPNIIVWMGPQIATTGVDGRYTFQPARTMSSIANVPNGGPSNVWYQGEAQVTDRANNTWFWNSTTSVITLSQLQSAYFNSVGRNSTLVLNFPPATTGQFESPDLDLLRQFGSWYTSLYTTNLVRAEPVTADSTWANSGFEAAKALDGDICSYWAADSSKTSGRLEVTPASAITFNLISIREPIELGERTTAYHVELKQNGAWNRTPSDISGTTLAGTVIGQRQLWQVNPTTAQAIALVIDGAKGPPAIAEFGVY
ncbi:MAG TPA: alpha-L-fucosidase [Polyangiaceae bacterium]